MIKNFNPFRSICELMITPVTGTSKNSKFIRLYNKLIYRAIEKILITSYTGLRKLGSK